MYCSTGRKKKTNQTHTFCPASSSLMKQFQKHFSVRRSGFLIETFKTVIRSDTGIISNFLKAASIFPFPILKNCKVLAKLKKLLQSWRSYCKDTGFSGFLLSVLLGTVILVPAKCHISNMKISFPLKIVSEFSGMRLEVTLSSSGSQHSF